MAAFSIGIKCNWCSKFRPRWRTHRLASNQVVCDTCLEWHFHALDFLGGGVPPKGCQVCGSGWDTLRAREPEEDMRMYVVPKDGIMQLLCRPCMLQYAGKRSDLYKDTDFGNQLRMI